MANAAPQFEDAPYVEPDHVDAVLNAVFGPDPAPPSNPWSGGFVPSTGDADRGYTATGSTPDYQADNSYSSEPAPMTYEDYSSPQGPALPVGARGMDPQLKDLQDAGPTVYMNTMYPDTAPALGNVVIPDDRWNRRDFRDDLDSNWSQVPPAMAQGTMPNRGTMFRDPTEYDPPGVTGQFDPNGRSIWANSPSTAMHEFGHQADMNRIGGPMTQDPTWQGLSAGVGDTPFYQNRWGKAGYGEDIPYEVTADEARTLLNGQAEPFISPAAQRYMLQNLMGVPGGEKTPGNPYVPGSTAYYNYERWQQSQQESMKPVTFYRSRSGG